MTTPRIGIIIGTIRQGRFADSVADWFMNVANNRDDMNADLVDLRDYPLPLFDEPMPPAAAPSQKPEVQNWQQRVAEFDGYVFLVAEYNNGIPGVLKNALDHVYLEWGRKPAAFIGYGSVGGARSVQHLRDVAVELQMAPLRHGVNIMGGDFMAVMKQQKALADFGYLTSSATEMLNQLVWWATALKHART